MKNSRSKFICLDCKVDTGKISEHYFVKDKIWLSVVNSNKGMLCIKCLEKRLGRKLSSKDFSNCFLNNPRTNPSGTSLLFLTRLNSN